MRQLGKWISLFLAASLLATSTSIAFATAMPQALDSGGLGGSLPPALDSGIPDTPLVYCDPMASEMIYCTTGLADWPLNRLPQPKSNWLFQKDALGNYEMVKEFSIEWDQAVYQDGIRSGAKRFIVPGRYGPALLSEEDRALWDAGLILIDPDCIARMEVLVVRPQPLPFSVSLGYDASQDSYYPIFSFPTPHGGEVLFEASKNGQDWFSFEEDYTEGSFGDRRAISSGQWALWDDQGEPVFFSAHQDSHYRVTVSGSAYAGTSDILTVKAVPVGQTPPDSDDDDIDGNRGGGGQGESDRPGKQPEAPPDAMPPVVPALKLVPASLTLQSAVQKAEEAALPQEGELEVTAKAPMPPALQAAAPAVPAIAPPEQPSAPADVPIPEQGGGSAGVALLSAAVFGAAVIVSRIRSKRKP